MPSNVLQAEVALVQLFEKRAGISNFVAKHHEALGHGAELAGLGVLAKPSIDDLRKKQPANESGEAKKKRHAKYELAGLGILAAPSAIHLAHSAYKRFRP
jgi:hypothetical protein